MARLLQRQMPGACSSADRGGAGLATTIATSRGLLRFERGDDPHRVDPVPGARRLVVVQGYWLDLERHYRITRGASRVDVDSPTGQKSEELAVQRRQLLCIH